MGIRRKSFFLVDVKQKIIQCLLVGRREGYREAGIVRYLMHFVILLSNAFCQFYLYLKISTYCAYATKLENSRFNRTFIIQLSMSAFNYWFVK
jgi:hypothetical protein